MKYKVSVPRVFPNILKNRQDWCRKFVCERSVNYLTTKRSSGLPTPITNYYIFRIIDLSILTVIFCKAIGIAPISPVACDILQNWYCSSIT